jgi:acetone carboxylase gamma subunit
VPEHDLSDIEQLVAGKLPLRLSIVRKASDRIVTCRCGHEFGDDDGNWKRSALIFVRDREDDLQEIYRGSEKAGPNWVQLREYYCPGCGAQLAVEAVPRGTPPAFEFLPDLDTFYREWLGHSDGNPE